MQILQTIFALLILALAGWLFVRELIRARRAAHRGAQWTRNINTRHRAENRAGNIAIKGEKSS